MADKKPTGPLPLVVWNHLGPTTELADGTLFPSTADATVHLFDIDKGPASGGLTLRLMFEVADGEPVLTTVVVATRKDDRQPINTATLRSLDLDGIVGQVSTALAFDVETGRTGHMPDEVTRTRIEGRFEGRRRPLTDENLREVADLYSDGLRVGKPTRHVADHLPTSYRNASRLIGEARRRGFIKEN